MAVPVSMKVIIGPKHGRSKSSAIFQEKTESEKFEVTGLWSDSIKSEWAA